MVNLRYPEALDDSIALAGWLGESDLEAEWQTRARDLRQRCRERFRDPKTGIFMDCWQEGARSTWTSQHTNALAVLTGAAKPEEFEGMLRHVLDPALLPHRSRPFMAINDVWGGWYQTVVDHTGYGEPKGANYPALIGYAATGFGAGWVVDSLFHAGMDREALDLIRFHWGEQIARGSTAGWELFDPYSQHSAVPQRTALGSRFRNSHCHVYSVLPTYLLSRYVLGVRPLEPGFASFEVDPRYSGLAWARGKVPTPTGDVSVDWRVDGDHLAVTLTVPDATEAVLSRGQGRRLGGWCRTAPWGVRDARVAGHAGGATRP